MVVFLLGDRRSFDSRARVRPVVESVVGWLGVAPERRSAATALTPARRAADAEAVEETRWEAARERRRECGVAIPLVWLASSNARPKESWRCARPAESSQQEACRSVRLL